MTSYARPAEKNFTDIREFNLMFKTFQGVTEDAKNTVYLRPETAQVFSKTLKLCKDIQKERSFGIGRVGKIFQKRDQSWKLYVPYKRV